MKFRLMPRDEGFYPLFRQAAENSVACSEVLRDLATRPADAADLVDKLIEGEHRGDDLVKAMKQRLDTSIVTPFDREDILALTEGIDHAVDEIRAAGEFIHLHHITEPLQGVSEMADILHDTAEAATTRTAEGTRHHSCTPSPGPINGRPYGSALAANGP